MLYQALSAVRIVERPTGLGEVRVRQSDEMSRRKRHSGHYRRRIWDPYWGLCKGGASFFWNSGNLFDFPETGDWVIKEG
ncbi:MAG: hypothetical protein V3R24_09560 [Gemmatimonadales bacterium]